MAPTVLVKIMLQRSGMFRRRASASARIPEGSDGLCRRSVRRQGQSVVWILPNALDLCPGDAQKCAGDYFQDRSEMHPAPGQSVSSTRIRIHELIRYSKTNQVLSNLCKKNFMSIGIGIKKKIGTASCFCFAFMSVAT